LAVDKLKNNLAKKNLDIDQLRESINYLAKENNVKKWDLGAYLTKDLSVQVDKGNAKQLKGSQRNAITIRVWNESNLLGITSTSDFTDSGIQKAFKGALEASYYGNQSECPQFSILAKDVLPKTINPYRDSADINTLLKTLKKAEKELINSHDYIDSVPYNGLSEAKIEKVYLNSDGAIRQMEVTQASLYLYAKGQSEGKKPRSAGSVRIGYGLEDINISECINESSNKTISHKDYSPILTSKYLVCFSPEAFLDLIGAFSNIFNARSILDGVSLSNKESVGQQISVPFLSLSDNPLHPDNIGIFTFDGEGTPKRNIDLIKNGILKNLLHSEATAREFKVLPTGHGSLGAKASVSPDWFVISKSNDSTCKHNDLEVKSYPGKYVLIDNLNALHAGVKASQGSFSLPFDGWIVESGNRISIEAATVAGGINEVLTNIIQIENNQISTHQGVSPYVWVDKLSITGEA
tara:strand:+ start:385 stop:1779 length:1395 start_codon:yes stop_codon:yes gene_type:complete